MNQPHKQQRCSDFDDGWLQLHGGNVNTVARKGSVVRRQIGPASPAVHQLLTWLHIQGFHQVPKLIEINETHEFLTFLAGRSIFRPWPEEVKTDIWLAQLSDWLRRYHSVVKGFRVQGEANFLWGPTDPEPGMVVCHGDLGPWNCIRQGTDLVGVIDWDLARYGDPLDDIAELALEAVPLRSNVESTMGLNTSRADLQRRLEVLCKVYGVVQADEVLRHIPDYLTRIIQDIVAQAECGVEPFVSFNEGGITEELEKDKIFVLTEWVNSL